jgi:hypothetical protein
VNVSIHYIAGLFDGEGSVGIYSNGKSGAAVPRVQLVQNVNELSAPLWEYFQERWGGYTSKSLSTNGRPKMNWQMSGASCLPFLREVQPFVILKAPQVDLLLAWSDNRAPMARDSRGRLVARSAAERAIDIQAMGALRALKKG